MVVVVVKSCPSSFLRKFDVVVIFAILNNFLFFKTVEAIFAIIFFVEMCVKFIALGFYGKYKDEWNLGLIQPDEKILVEDEEGEEGEMKEIPRDYEG